MGTDSKNFITGITFKDLPPPYRENEEEAIQRESYQLQIPVRLHLRPIGRNNLAGGKNLRAIIGMLSYRLQNSCLRL